MTMRSVFLNLVWILSSLAARSTTGAGTLGVSFLLMRWREGLLLLLCGTLSTMSWPVKGLSRYQNGSHLSVYFTLRLLRPITPQLQPLSKGHRNPVPWFPKGTKVPH